MAIPSLLTRFTQPGGSLVRLMVVGATLFALSPLASTFRPPMQDLPQHLAAGRVLLDTDPALSFGDYFTTEWARSQYLGIYVLLGAFFYPLRWLCDEPLLWANRCALVVLLATWVLGAEQLGQRTLRRKGLGAFALALFFNVHLILGFLNFLLGVAFAFVALALFAEQRVARPTLRVPGWRLWLLGPVALACFYFHVVPFGILLALVTAAAAGDALLGAWFRRRGFGLAPRAHWATYLAFLPAVLALLFWLATPAGLSTREAASGGGSRGKAQYSSFASNHAALPSWTMDSFRSEWDMHWLLVLIAALAVYATFEASLRFSSRRSARTRPVLACDVVLVWLLRLTAPACVLGYYVLPASYDWIWPINARFPLLALLFLPYWLPVALPTPDTDSIAFLPRARRWAGAAFTAAVLSSAIGQTLVARRAFAGFREEIAGLDEVLNQIPLGKRVATLVFERGSRHIGFSPFLHVGAYYQAQRGGVSFFSFNDFPQSPVRFREDNRPPRVEPRWEWKPEKVRPDRDLGWFDYLLVRGGSATLKSAETFQLVASEGRFRLYRRTQ